MIVLHLSLRDICTRTSLDEKRTRQVYAKQVSYETVHSVN